MKLFLLIMLAVFLRAQVIVSFSPGTKLSRGIYRWSVTACSNDPVSLDSGWIYQSAARLHIPALSVTEAIRLATRAHNHDPLVVAVNGAQLGSSIGAYLTTAGTISANPHVTGYLLLASGAAALAGNFLRAKIPGDYAANLLEGVITLAPGGCAQRDMFSRQMKGASAREAVIQIPKF